MSQSYSNVVYYSNACEKVFERNIDSLKKEIETNNFINNLPDFKGKRTEKDFDDLDKMLETIILLEGSKKQTNTKYLY